MIFTIISCTSQNNDEPKSKTDRTRAEYYNNIIFRHDTLKMNESNDIFLDAIHTIQKDTNYKAEPYYWVFKCFYSRKNKKTDSIPNYLSQIDTSAVSPDIFALHEYLSLKQNMDSESIGDEQEMENLILRRDKIEKSKSVFVYLFDDLLAMKFYNNSDLPNSLVYLKKYMANHPYSNSLALRQRYFDIRFMISQKTAKIPEMQSYLDSSRLLAVQLKDTNAYMRTVDYEAQLYTHKGNNKKALEKMKEFYNYSKKSNKLYPYVSNNLARAFNKNNEPDSTIKYLNLQEGFQKNVLINAKDYLSEIDLMSDAYEMKGDYKNALYYKKLHDEAFKDATFKLQRSKIAELSLKYETAKKDQDILLLKSTNDLNTRLLNQQKILFIVLFCFAIVGGLLMYKVHKQKLLESKHNQLVIKNKQLHLEQKNRQIQLNPHFIYNSIANLQGLIGADKKYEANTYLVSLTKLIRDVLELNNQDFITLDQEVSSLKNYILLQRMRYPDIFDFLIDVHDLDMDDILIPPMLIQPFVENSIEYGFKNISYKGQLQISFDLNDQLLIVVVQDNGKGVKDKPTSNKNKTSLSQKITKERLDFLYRNNKVQAELIITPNFRSTDDGYMVELKLPLMQVFN